MVFVEAQPKKREERVGALMGGVGNPKKKRGKGGNRGRVAFTQGKGQEEKRG